MSVAAPPRMLAPRLAAALTPARGAAAPPGYALGYALFLLLNIILFIRPNEYVPGLIGLELYQFCILACVLVSFPAVLFQLVPRELEYRPMTVCVLAVAAVIAVTGV